MAEIVGNHMASQGTRFIRPAVPSKIEKLSTGKFRVSYKIGEGESMVTASDVFDTVVYAAGRKTNTSALNLDVAGVKVSQSGKIIADPYDKTTTHHIFAIGDCALGRPELTPTAILSGKLLARRLVKGSQIHMDYSAVSTTVFTPIEYSCVGLSEEDAIQKFGSDSVEVYHSYFTPLEHTVPHLFDMSKRPENICYLKVICNKEDEDKVVGIHLFAPNSGEVIQGFGLAMLKKLTKTDLDHAISIHPSIGEELMLLKTTKSSGEDPVKRGC
jgi:thioredoxin reductase (NADPH)